MRENGFDGRSVLVVDDEENVLLGIKYSLKLQGLTNVITCSDSRRVMDILADTVIDVIMLDLSMPHLSGEEVLAGVTEHYPDIPAIVVTGMNDVETAVRCMKNGAFDYMVKPVEDSRLISGIVRALEMRELRGEIHRLRERLHTDKIDNPGVFAEIVTRNPVMHSIFRYIETIAVSPRPVLITGETGVGKELVAAAFHRLADTTKPFVAVNVAGLDDAVFSDTLFGHTRGAYTGALESRRGLIDEAAGGVLFLDEIGDLAPASQIKLLRLLQDGTYYPLGSDMKKKCDARILVATNRDLESQSRDGSFRKDLFYRLATHHVRIPPLRERLDDLSFLVDHFLEIAAEALGKKKPTPPRELMTLLGAYSFPGNVRELESMIWEAVSTHTDRVMSLDVFKNHVSRKANGAECIIPQTGADDTMSPVCIIPPCFPTLKELTGYAIAEALRRADGNQSVAAHLLGITPQALSKRLKGTLKAD